VLHPALPPRETSGLRNCAFPGLLGTLWRVNPSQIRHLDDLQKSLSGARFLLFKHSNRCGTSDRAFQQYTRFLAEHDDLPTGWIDVVEHRTWSDEVARITGVVHESPQALWIRDGEVAWHASHWDITVDTLTNGAKA